MARTGHLPAAVAGPRIDAANLVALDRELRAAQALAGGHGLIAVNVMRAVKAYPAYVRQACESGADAIVMGAGLPDRAVATPWLRSHLAAQPRKAELARAKARCVMAFDCLTQCGLRDGIGRFGQFCIDRQLAAAVKGDVRTGLFFRGAGRLPFRAQIRPVGDLMRLRLTGVPAAA